MKIVIIAFLSVCWSIVSFSQEATASGRMNKIKFTSTNQFGLLNGSGGASYDLQSINGVAFGKWSGGVGVGIDNYINRSIPLFLNITREFGKKGNTPFVYAGAGLNYTWLNHVQKEQKGLPYSTTPGLYTDAGFGIKFKTNNNVGINLSAGFSYKQSKETVPQWFWIMPVPGEDNVEKLNSHFRRIVIRIGFQI